MLSSRSTTHRKERMLLTTATLIVTAFALVIAGRQTFTSDSKGGQDGPVDVTYGNLFQKGELKFEPFDLKDLPPLPAGYVALNNRAYRITTSAIVAGRHTVRFAVPSVTEENVFQKLRIFHVDNDPFDPDGYVWVDVTVSKSATASANFSTKTIYGQAEGLGIFVIARLVREMPPSTAIADLVVTTTGVTDRITAPNVISYTIKVVNKGPDTASDIGLWDSFAGPAYLVSVQPSQGKCKPTYSAIVCKPGFLKAGESIVVSVKLKPDEGRGSFPQDGREITHNAGAKAVEKDPATQNNEASDTVLVFPDPNQLPSVTLNSPADQSLFVGPVDITLEATATDSDGSISKVEFFDSDKSLGFGTSVDGKNFVLIARGVSYGKHLFVAVATDNGGRTDWSLSREVFVNGLSIVSVKTPAPESLVAPGSDLTLEARTSHPSGVIDKVQFFANGRLLGEGSLSGQNTYSFNWKEPHRGNYSVAVIAIDGSGIPTLSAPVQFSIGKRPEVVIISPTDSARFSDPTNLNIVVKAKQTEAVIRRVEFYADDRLIGSSLDIGAEIFRFTWRYVPKGQHTLKAVAVDEFGVSGTSKPITFRVEKSRKNH